MKFYPIRTLMFAVCFLALAAAPGTAIGQIHIQSIDQLQKIGDNASYPINGSYVLDNDIDASATRTWNNNGAGGYYGFDPIGDNASKYFSGTLDGNMHVIFNLYINRPAEPNIGLFGFVGGTGLGANGGTIRNVMLDNATIIGSSATGGLIGTLRKGTVSVCYSKGRVTGTDRVGGFIGDITLYGTVTNCYSTAVVNGASNVGGLVGGIVATPIIYPSAITNCYSAGAVPGSGATIGGFLGNRGSNVTLTACFWDTETSGTGTGVGTGSATGATGKLTDEMMTKSTFTGAGWNFTSVWNLFSRRTYPFFRGPDNAPVGLDDSYQTEPDTALTVDWPGVLANDTDADGDGLTAVLVGTTAHGTLVLNSDGSFNYLPDSGFAGTDNFTYRANDGIDESDITMVTIYVSHNHPPVIVANSYTTGKDTPLTVAAPGVLGNDSDPDGDSLTAVLATTTAHGTLVLNEDGSFTYTPKTNYRGTDTFTYKANDGRADSGAATVTIRVGSNEAPVAQSDNYTTPRNTPLTVAAPGVLGNDTDADNDTLTAVLANTTDHGTLVLSDNGSFTYTPEAGYAGADSFTYRASDGLASSAVATVRITVGSNDAPVVESDNYTTPRNTPLTVAAPGVLGNDSDPDGDGMSAVLTNTTDHGTLVLSDNGSFTYTPQTGYAGTDIFTYRAYDGYGYSAIATVRITVGSNAVPVAQSDNYTTPRNTPLTVAAPGVLGNDSDSDGDGMIAVLTNTADHGTLVLSDNGSFTYTPQTGYAGTDTFTYRAYDGYGYSAIATVRITVGSNAVPVVTPDNYTTAIDAPLAVAASGVLANDTDADSDPLTAVLVRNPAHGTLILNADGSFTYTPNTGYKGRDTFTYRASDGMVNSGVATVTITVGSNAAPVVTPDSYFVDRNDTLTVPADGVLANDSDADGDSLTAVLVTGAANGALVFNADGSCTYTPLTDYRGLDSFSYKANDGMADSAVTTVTITVGSNEPPQAVSDNYTTPRNTPLTIGEPGVLGNDSDPDGDSLTAVLAGTTVHGTLVLSDNGSFIYTPDDGFVGIDTFTYVANDGMAGSAIATAVIHVGRNAVPQVASDHYQVQKNTVLAVDASAGVLANDADADNDTLTAVLVSTVAHGVLALSDNGSFTYTPDAGYTGSDTFTYVANDGYAGSAVATVSIDVLPPSGGGGGGGGGGSGGGAPLAVADSYRTAARTTPLVITAPGVLGNDIGGGLTAILEAEPMFGSLALNANGSFIYISTADHGCTDSFMYRASNGSGQSASVTVTIIVNAAPSAASDTYNVFPGTPALVVAPGVLGNDSDADGDKLQAELVSAPLNGAFILAADGAFQYTPNAGFIGNDSFTYKAYDGFEYSAPVTVVLPVKISCPVVAVYGEGSSEVAALRKFRDGVLEKTDAGRAMIKLYYNMAPALEQVIANNALLRQSARAAIDRILPVIDYWLK